MESATRLVRILEVPGGWEWRLWVTADEPEDYPSAKAALEEVRGYERVLAPTGTALRVEWIWTTTHGRLDVLSLARAGDRLRGTEAA